MIELADALTSLGHEIELVGPDEVYSYCKKNNLTTGKYSDNLRNYISNCHDKYDVIDIDINFLFESLKNLHFSNSLIVARSVLFIPHLLFIKIPIKQTLVSSIKYKIKKIFYGDYLNNQIEKVEKGLKFADIINVSNHEDFNLVSSKYAEGKDVLCLPFGMFPDKFERLLTANSQKNENNIVFIGTFDFRKGCLDIPKIFALIKKDIPNAKLFIYGAKGLYSRVSDVMSFFPSYLQKDINVKMQYTPDELPELLKNKKVSIFPSYLEGFGFAVLESLAASIPVIAYNSPGPSSILNKEYLVRPGDYVSFAEKVIQLLCSDNEYNYASSQAITTASRFKWEDIALDTVRHYQLALETKRAHLKSN